MVIIDKYIKMLHEHKNSFVEVVVTGGSSTFQGLLGLISGCSNTLLNAELPYAQEASTRYLGLDDTNIRKLGGYVSKAFAQRLSAKAWSNGRFNSFGRKGVHPYDVVGLGITATIDSGVEKRGQFRAFISLRSAYIRKDYSLLFPKDENNISILGRTLENDICDFVGLKLILSHFDIATIDFADFRSTDRPNGLSTKEMELIEQEYTTEEEVFCDTHMVGGPHIFLPENGIAAINQYDESFDLDDYFLMPCSADPLHVAHEEMARVISTFTGKKPLFLIEMVHPKKGKLSLREVNRRVMQFNSLYAVAVTCGAGTYAKMGELFPKTSIVIGTDNMSRISDKRYLEEFKKNSNDDLSEMNDKKVLEQAMMPYHNYNTSFYVFEREGSGYSFDKLIQEMPWGFGDLFHKIAAPIPEISSTEIRESKLAEVIS